MSRCRPVRTRLPSRCAASWSVRTAPGVLLALAGAAAAAAQQQDPPSPSAEVQPDTEAPPTDPTPDLGLAEDLGDLDLGDELFLFEDMPVIVSATRRPQQQNLASMPVSVLSSSDLHFSGLTSIGEALQFAPGVDFLQIDRNRVAVGVRGLHDYASDRTLTLLDGRNATDPAFGTTLLTRLPLFIEDVERVEVARGPGGAAWGANAFNGVINIITKRPEDTQGLLINGQVNHFGDIFTQARYGDTSDGWAYRVSAGYESRESSQDAIDGDDFESNDLARNMRIDSVAAKETDGGRLTTGFAFGRFEEGDFEFTLRQPFETGVSEVARTFVRFDRELEGDDSAHLQWYANYVGADDASVTKRDQFETDIEGQLNLADRDGHDLSFGANARAVYVNGVARHPQDYMLGDDPHLDAWFGAFILDHWQARDRLIFETQARIDYYTETGVDWSGRFSALLTLDEEHAGVLRLSAAKAFRAPGRGLTDGGFQSNPLPAPAPPGTFATTLISAEDLDNEQTYSVEAGYAMFLADGVQLRADAYYQWYEDLIGSTIVTQNGPATVFQLQNIDGAEAWGLETSMSLTRESWRLKAWYAFHELQPDRSDQDLRAHYPAEHKAGVTALVDLGERLTLACNYRYSDVMTDGGAFDRKTPVSHRIDLTLSTPIASRGELMIGVADLFDQTQFAASSVGSFSPHETPGMTLFARLQLQY